MGRAPRVQVASPDKGHGKKDQPWSGKNESNIVKGQDQRSASAGLALNTCWWWMVKEKNQDRVKPSTGGRQIVGVTPSFEWPSNSILHGSTSNQLRCSAQNNDKDNIADRNQWAVTTWYNFLAGRNRNYLCLQSEVLPKLHDSKSVC